MKLMISPWPWNNGKDRDGDLLMFEDERSPCETRLSEIRRNNRRLVDAAPELYEALEQCLIDDELASLEAGGGIGRPTRVKAAAALAKARGE